MENMRFFWLTDLQYSKQRPLICTLGLKLAMTNQL
jgi:hypothetical protein